MLFYTSICCCKNSNYQAYQSHIKAFDLHQGIWKYMDGEASSIIKVSSDGFKTYNLGDDCQSINYHRTFSFTEDAFGNLWIAPYNGRLMKYNKELDILEDVAIEYPVSEVVCILTVKGDNASGNYDVKKLNTAIERNKGAGLLFYTVPGPKMLWQFRELGCDYSINRCEDGSINDNCRL